MHAPSSIFLLLLLLAARLPPTTASASPSNVTFHDVSLSVSGRPVLSSASGVLSAGRLLAIMGPSGGGKTSLLNAIAGRVQRLPKSKKESSKKSKKREASGKSQILSLLSGSRFLDGDPLPPSALLPCAYIKQTDLFFPHQTVQETLTFRVRLKTDLGPSEVAEEVAGLLSAMSLEKCRDTIIGNERTRGISGGE